VTTDSCADRAEDRLTPLQRDVLRAFFAREQGFFLTGGAALAGFHLRHRQTTDLDFFTHAADAFERGRHVLAAVAEDLGATLSVRQDAPGFQRFVVSRGDQGVVVDLVWERVPSAFPDKLDFAGIRVDPADEIVVNKLTTLVSRSEERDTVDLMLLERAGHALEPALPLALAKDGGCTPAALAWVLAQIHVGDDAVLPAGVTPAELRDYLAGLVRRLRQAAAPAVME
jgi:hypothetical protein